MDKNKLAYVIRNLLSNALKFTPPGGVVKVLASQVQLGAAASSGDGDCIRVQVVDSGAGIDVVGKYIVISVFTL